MARYPPGSVSHDRDTAEREGGTGMTALTRSGPMQNTDPDCRPPVQARLPAAPRLALACPITFGRGVNLLRGHTRALGKFNAGVAVEVEDSLPVALERLAR